MSEIKYSSAELMSINAARLLRDGDVVFVGVGQPNLACNLAKRTHAPNLVMICEAGVIGAEPARLPLSIGEPTLVSGSLSVVSMYDETTDGQVETRVRKRDRRIRAYPWPAKAWLALGSDPDNTLSDDWYELDRVIWKDLGLPFADSLFLRSFNLNLPEQVDLARYPHILAAHPHDTIHTWGDYVWRGPKKLRARGCHRRPRNARQSGLQAARVVGPQPLHGQHAAQPSLWRHAHHERCQRTCVSESTVHPGYRPARGRSVHVGRYHYARTGPGPATFLKSNPVEMRHIIDDLLLLALSYPDLFFLLHHNNEELYHLPPGNLRQRLIAVFGKDYNKKVVPVTEETDAMRLEGFVGKPESSKKGRGEQFFFANQRYIRSNYLHHAVMTDYEDLLPKETYPFYVLFIDIDPARIDINVHPTKQEIKFDDEKIVYAFVNAAVKHGLAKYSITPTLDFPGT